MQQPHVLSVDSANISQRMLLKSLGKHFMLSMVEDCEHAHINLKNGHFDFLIINFDTIGTESYSLSTLLRTECSASPYTSVILISSYMSDEFIYRSTHHGVNLCLPRTLQSEQLCSVLMRQYQKPVTQLCFRNICTVQCIQWNFGNIYYQYSADLQELVVGGSAEEAHQLMQELIESHREQLIKAQFGQAHVETVKHRLDISPN